MGVRSTKRCSHALDDKVMGKLCNISAVCQTNHVSQRGTKSLRRQSIKARTA